RERPLDLGQSEGGRLGGDDEVAGKSDLAAAGEGRAVDRGDDGLLALTGGDAGEAAPGGLKRGGLAGGDGLEVGAGAEDRSLTGDDAHPDLGIVLQLVDGGFHAGGNITVDRVAGFGAVDAKDRDPSVLLVLNHGA